MAEKKKGVDDEALKKANKPKPNPKDSSPAEFFTKVIAKGNVTGVQNLDLAAAKRASAWLGVGCHVCASEGNDRSATWKVPNKANPQEGVYLCDAHYQLLGGTNKP